MKLCTACGSPRSGRTCPECGHAATGQRGSTRAGRRQRDRLLTAGERRPGGLTCRDCGRALTRDQVHADHRVPLARGGADTDTNLQVLCGPCNLAKGAA